MSQITPVESMSRFACAMPEFPKGKRVITLGRTDRLWAGVQYVKEGGENNLHSHTYMDGVYFVIKGRVRFYGENDVVLGEAGPNEGFIISRGFRYWFESCGDEALELLLVQCFDRAMTKEKQIDDDRIDHVAKKASQTSGDTYVHSNSAEG
jgi:mannose-6-phosphate isomerase-like protein (cupin superfamily)